MKNSMLYLMHVDWSWAKQRPHFIAEGLAKYFDVRVRFPFIYQKALTNTVPAPDSLKVKPIRRLPLERFGMMVRINRLLARVQLIRAARSSSVVWVTHPGMFDLVGRRLARGAKLVYDCMDDALEFPDTRSDPRRRSKIAAIEERLIDRADVVFSSSHYLKGKLQARYGADRVIHVVNNGVRMPPERSPDTEDDPGRLNDILGAAAQAPGRRILYVGTVSEWFDFDLVLRSLDEVEGISYVIVGPCEVTPPGHERLFVVPPVQHGDVARLMAWADALVMPFHLTELIRSVNPVKVYEYIDAGKPAIVLRYGETEVFDRYVHLYASAEEYLVLVRAVASGDLLAKVESDVARQFVRENSWTARVDTVMSHLRLLSRTSRGADCSAPDRRPYAGAGEAD